MRFLIERKGACDAKIVKRVAQWIDALGYKRIVVKSDSESAVVSVQEAVRKDGPSVRQ